MDRQVSILNIILSCLPSGLLFRVLQDRCRGNIWTLLNTKAVNSHRCTVYIYYGDICAFALAFMLFKTLRRKKTLQKKHSENFSESERYLSKFRVHCFLLTLSQKRENYQLLLCNKIGFKYILQPMKCARPKPIT